MGLVIGAFLACVSEPLQPALARFECGRCHDGGAAFASAPEERSCVDCHRAILRGEWDDRVLPEDVARWKQHLHRLNETPSLARLDQRVTRSWLVSWLREPTDLRPGLPAQMPRLPITPADAEALADALHVVDPPAQTPGVGDPRRGLALVAERCAPCHASDPLAPDLASIRERSWPAAVAGWLTDPSAVLPGTRMPDPDLTESELADVVAALFSGGLQGVPLPEVPGPAPSPGRPITWDEVNERVFREVCRHCHADPVPVGGDGGPGNTGGFGFGGAGLDLSSWEAATADPVLLRPGAPDGLVGRLWARHQEVAGTPVPGVLGMPLGLPPLDPAEIALVEAWVAQGAPR